MHTVTTGLRKSVTYLLAIVDVRSSSRLEMTSGKFQLIECDCMGRLWKVRQSVGDNSDKCIKFTLINKL